MRRKEWPLDGNVKPWMWRRRSPRSALISHLYLLGNPQWQPWFARDPVCEAMLLTQGYISITEGSESDEQLICLINPSFSKKNIWSWGADLLSCSYPRIKKWVYASRICRKPGKSQFRFIFVWSTHPTNRSKLASTHPLLSICSPKASPGRHQKVFSSPEEKWRIN